MGKQIPLAPGSGFRYFRQTLKTNPTPGLVVLEGHCAGPGVCPLNRVRVGTLVCIKELIAAPEIQNRLRELGLGEEQQIKLLSREANVICQVCNARLGISEKLAEAILVEAVATPVAAS
jgi:Fe2+ transport system protein FeoA